MSMLERQCLAGLHGMPELVKATPDPTQGGVAWGVAPGTGGSAFLTQAP